jgi:small subunit ribosomal protein S4
MARDTSPQCKLCRR